MSQDSLSPAFVYGLGAAVALAWIVSVFADILIPSYSTPIALHGLMGTVVGSVFADAGLRRARKKMAEEFTEGPKEAGHDRRRD